jgi:cell division protein FtsZ
MTDNDPAIDRMAEVIRSMVEIMRHGNMPAVDFQDERVVLIEGGIAYSGTGEATGPDRARRAAEIAVRDLLSQLPPGLST